MWIRNTLHSLATELLQNSEEFRRIWTKNPQNKDELEALSITGVELLRILTLAIRSDQDSNLIGREKKNVVGVLSIPTLSTSFNEFKKHYCPPYRSLQGFQNIYLRDALNKIAHVHPHEAGFYADERHHDLIISGRHGKDYWIAVISIIDLCDTIQRLPDGKVS